MRVAVSEEVAENAKASQNLLARCTFAEYLGLIFSRFGAVRGTQERWQSVFAAKFPLQGGDEEPMKRLVLPQPKRRSLPPLAAVSQGPPPGQLVEVIRGELSGTRGVLVRTGEKGRWLVRLEGTVAGILVSMPRSGLRVVPARRG